MDTVPPTASSISPAEFPLDFHPAVPVTQLSSHSAPPSTPQPLNSVSKSAQSIRKQTPVKLSGLSFRSLPQRQSELLLWARCGSGQKRKGFWEETVNTGDGLPSGATAGFSPLGFVCSFCGAGIARQSNTPPPSYSMFHFTFSLKDLAVRWRLSNQNAYRLLTSELSSTGLRRNCIFCRVWAALPIRAFQPKQERDQGWFSLFKIYLEKKSRRSLRRETIRPTKAL